jgi:hypothetical protein
MSDQAVASSTPAEPTKQTEIMEKLATVAVVGVAVALVEVALIPGLLIGAAAAFLPDLMPKMSENFRPMMKASIKASIKAAQKTREAFAEASEQVQDMVAEAKMDHEEEATPVAEVTKPAAKRARKS